MPVNKGCRENSLDKRWSFGYCKVDESMGQAKDK